MMRDFFFFYNAEFGDVYLLKYVIKQVKQTN